MIHPVAACATAGVSLELAADLIRGGKADVVVGGGFDDLGAEGIVGFAEMSATADDARMADAGFSPREMSRPGDRSAPGSSRARVAARSSSAAGLSPRIWACRCEPWSSSRPATATGCRPRSPLRGRAPWASSA